MLMKPREVARHEFGKSNQLYAYAGVSALCGCHFTGIWVFGTEAAERPDQIRSLVAFSVSLGGNRNRLGHVPVFSLTIAGRATGALNCLPCSAKAIVKKSAEVVQW